MLHWIARARARLVPPAGRPGAVLVDLGCGGGLLAPYVQAKGYRHVGVDVTESALSVARQRGVHAVRGDVTALPLADGTADVVSAGEILEHVDDLPAAVAGACRLLRPGGCLVVDSIAATRLARLLAIEVAERLPGAVPRGIHDPALFVDRDQLVRECARHGVAIRLRGISPHLVDALKWFAGRRTYVRMVPVPTTAVLFQGRGTKDG